MKNLILIALAVLIYGCSKDDESKPAPTVTDPELEVWVYGNNLYPHLTIMDNGVLTTDINNNDRHDQEMPAHYFRDKLEPGNYIYTGSCWQDMGVKLDNDTVWARLIIIYKNDTILDSLRRATTYVNAGAFIGFQHTVN